jgi:pyruvate-formate lyase
VSLTTLDTTSDLTRPSDRVAAIRKTLLDSRYSICLERPRLLQEFRSSAEGRGARADHPLVRRATALAYLFSHRRPNVYPDELIIGNMTSKRVAANYYIEGGSVNILEDVLRLEKKATVIEMSPRERLSLVAVGLRNLFRSIGGRALLRPGRIKHFLDFFMAKRYFITEEAGVGHQCGDYMMVVHRGLKDPDEEAKLRLETGKLADGTPLDADQRAFYRSIRITIEGVRKMAANLADEAERQATLHGVTPERRAELLRAAESCRRVPYEPARTLAEALQSIWLVHIAFNLEDFEQGVSFGRLDQILYPLFLTDIEAGHLTPEGAAELLASFGLKTCETMPIYSERVDRFFSGNGVAQAITVGGTDADGNDVTNELSGIILDSYAQILTREPALHVRIHPSSPPWLMEKAVAVLQRGTSRPSLFGDTAVVAALEEAGISRAHARDYAVIGCVEMCSQGRTYNSSDAALFNLPLCLELALNEGRRFPRTARGGERRSRLGAVTMPVDRMASFDDLVEALRAQVRDSVDEMAKVIGWLEEVYRVHRPTPVNSMMTQGCLRSGRDVTWGGGMYDFTSIQAAGLATTGNSLYAIKRLVFDEKRMTLDELVRILKDDWRGHEVLRAEVSRKFGKYGNGDTGRRRRLCRCREVSAKYQGRALHPRLLLHDVSHRLRPGDRRAARRPASRRANVKRPGPGRRYGAMRADRRPGLRGRARQPQVGQLLRAQPQVRQAGGAGCEEARGPHRALQRLFRTRGDAGSGERARRRTTPGRTGRPLSLPRPGGQGRRLLRLLQRPPAGGQRRDNRAYLPQHVRHQSPTYRE